MKSVSTSLSELGELPQGLSETEVLVDGEKQSLIVFCEGDHIRAWLNICPHAGRRLDYALGKFLRDGHRLVCAAHGASFDLSNGECIAGPCRGQSLVAVQLHSETGIAAIKTAATKTID